MSDSITTKKLNPLLFNEDKALKPEIKSKIEEIVKVFLDYLQVDIRVADIRLVGSNASYNYNVNSDLDIHITTDVASISDPEIIARLYFDAAKKNFKDDYDIKIKGIEVELYVEDINTTSVSNGIYSVTKDKWIKEPVVIEEPTEDVKREARKIEREIVNSIKKAKDADELTKVVDDLYLMRKDALSTGGEMSAGNLAFKALRNKGILTRVKNTLHTDQAKELSLESKKVKKESLEEDRKTLKTLKGSAIKRSKYGVGKEIGGQIYFHKDYITDIPPAEKIYEKAVKILQEKYPKFKWRCLMYDKKKPNTLRFDEAPDFDTAREPIPGVMYTVNVDTGEVKERASVQIWHHKWMWVKDDYTGFNVDKSYEWSMTWLQKITSPSGKKSKWEQELRDAGLK